MKQESEQGPRREERSKWNILITLGDPGSNQPDPDDAIAASANGSGPPAGGADVEPQLAEVTE